jgi:hypothetical protein
MVLIVFNFLFADGGEDNDSLRRSWIYHSNPPDDLSASSNMYREL